MNEKIDSILKDMDWEAIHRVMKFLNWKWFVSQGKYATPSVETLKAKGRELLSSAIKNKTTKSISSGGLVATKFSNGYVELAFVVSRAGYPYE